MNSVKSSTARTSNGGTTNIGSTYLTAVNQSSQYGYAYASASGVGIAYLSHTARASTVNSAYWTFGAQISGQLYVKGIISY